MRLGDRRRSEYVGEEEGMTPDPAESSQGGSAFGVLILLGGTAVAPFIYTLF